MGKFLGSRIGIIDQLYFPDKSLPFLGLKNLLEKTLIDTQSVFHDIV